VAPPRGTYNHDYDYYCGEGHVGVFSMIEKKADGDGKDFS